MHRTPKYEVRRAYNEDIGDERGTGWWTATDEIVESSQAYIEEGDIGGRVFPLIKKLGEVQGCSMQLLSGTR